MSRPVYEGLWNREPATKFDFVDCVLFSKWSVADLVVWVVQLQPFLIFKLALSERTASGDWRMLFTLGLGRGLTVSCIAPLSQPVCFLYGFLLGFLLLFVFIFLVFLHYS